MSGGEIFHLHSGDGLVLQARISSPTVMSPLPDGTSGAVVLVHGITADLDEGGMYGRSADQLAAASFGVLRLSFRGHGASAGTQRDVTIAGKMLDVEAASARAGIP